MPCIFYLIKQQDSSLRGFAQTACVKKTDSACRFPRGPLAEIWIVPTPLTPVRPRSRVICHASHFAWRPTSGAETALLSPGDNRAAASKPRALPLRHRAHRTAPGLMHIDTRQSVKKTDTPFRTSASPSKRLAHSGTIQLKKAPCFHGALVKRVTLYAGVTPRRRSSLTLASREAHAQQAEAKQTQRCRL